MTDNFNYPQSVKDIELEIDQSVQFYCIKNNKNSHVLNRYCVNGDYFKSWVVGEDQKVAWLSVTWDGKQYVGMFKNSLDILNGK